MERAVLHQKERCMSFVLPGNARSLRFTGEAKALDLPPPPTTNRGATGVALGKPRVRKPSTPPPPPPPRINTPTPSSRYGEPRYLGSINPPVIRHNEMDSTGENATYAMDRDALDVLPGGGRIATPKPGFANPIPVPNFRPAHEIHHQQQQFLNQPPLEAPQGGASWAVWLLASIVMGVLMYFAAPAMLLTPVPHAQAQAAPIVSATP